MLNVENGELSSEIALVEDNFVLWERIARQSRQTAFDAQEVVSEMLRNWYSNPDMYASYLNSRGWDCARYVPSILVNEPTVVRHRLGHRVVRVPVSGTTSSSFPQAMIFNMNLLNIFRKRTPRLIHFNTYYSSYFSLSPINRIGSKITSQYSGGEPPSGGPVAQRLRWLLPVRLGLSLSNGVLISNFSAEERRQREILDKYYGIRDEKIFDFPVLLIDDALFFPRDQAESTGRLGFREDRINVLIVSSIAASNSIGPLSKDPFTVLRLFQWVQNKSDVPFHLHFVGSGRGFSELQSLVSELHMQDEVTLHSLVDHEKLPLYYSACDVAINPYRSLDLRVGTATVESFACGRPSIMFKRMSTLPTIQPGGFLIDPEPQRGAEELIEILRDTDSLRRKGREGQEIAKRFHIKNVGNRFSEIINLVTTA